MFVFVCRIANGIPPARSPIAGDLFASSYSNRGDFVMFDVHGSTCARCTEPARGDRAEASELIKLAFAIDFGQVGTVTARESKSKARRRAELTTGLRSESKARTGLGSKRIGAGIRIGSVGIRLGN
ncbi:hypothetical protein EVAR_81870_1 [Eumeta japonica]|uniref:Uncharacterized protein n=1 Tax=Eumeta variegata TaxID=151549 RepID=A0A4C1UYE3_EUMVA|nr:hypothetical protein EVAR_81870_1 [Eumeta japonica]